MRRYELKSIESLRFRRGCQFGPKFQGTCPTDHSACQKTRMFDLSYGTKNVGRTFFRFVTIQASGVLRAERRKDSFTIAKPHCIQCSAVKMTK